MRDVIRRVCVSLFIVSFVFSGATWAACIELPGAAAASHDHAHTVTTGDAMHHDDHVGGGQTAAAPDQGPDHNLAPIVKCCSVSPVFSMAPNISATPVNFSGAAISFRVAQRDLTGFVIALDPGIPKPIV